MGVRREISQAPSARRPADSRTPNGLREMSLRSLSRLDFCTMECLQVLDGARSSEVEGVFSDTEVARVVPLALRDMGELVLDHRALTQRFASSGSLDLLAKPLLELFVLGDCNGPPVAELGGGALRAQRAAIADVGIKLDDGPEARSVALVRSDIRSCGREC